MMSDYLPWSVEHMAAEEMQQDWNDLRFQSVFQDAYKAGGDYVKHYAEKEIARLKTELESLREQTRWRDVREELPALDVERLWFDGDKTMSDEIKVHIDTLTNSTHDGRICCVVNYLHNYTHWMPLPSHPTTQAKD